MLEQVADRFTHIITIEDNVVLGGFGSAVTECYARKGITGVLLKAIGIPDRFIEHGAPTELSAELGLDAGGIARVIREFLKEVRSPDVQHARAIA